LLIKPHRATLDELRERLHAYGRENIGTTRVIIDVDLGSLL